jgi:hypothetical protein
MLSPVLTCRSEVGLVGKKEVIFTLEEDNISGEGLLPKSYLDTVLICLI